MTAAALAQNRHQGGLREFVNQKLAPYVKKALKDVCDVDAEYPLQWIGEHLINQSFLYENNPDTTGIKERFFYNFDEPEKPATTPGAAAAEHVANTNTVAPVDPQQASSLHTVPVESIGQLHNGDQVASRHMIGADEAYDIREQEPMDVEQEHHNSDTHTNLLNGVTEAAQEESSADQVNGDRAMEGAGDTEMAGTA